MQAHPKKRTSLPCRFLCVILGMFLSLWFQSTSASPLCAVVLAAGTSQKVGPPPAARLATADCQECKFSIGTALPPYSVSFKIREVEGSKKVIEALRVTREDKAGWEQILTVPLKEWDSFPKDAEFSVGVDDLNFDGYNDIFLLTGLAAHNSAFDYWLFEPSGEEFIYLGKYPEFRIDTKRQTLRTHETGGRAGLVYRDKEYRYIKGKLTLVRHVDQDETDRLEIFRRKTYRLKDGKLRLIKTELIRVPGAK